MNDTEELRGYLKTWLEQPCTFEETKVKEIGDGFINFFTLLLQLGNDTEDGDQEQC